MARRRRRRVNTTGPFDFVYRRIIYNIMYMIYIYNRRPTYLFYIYLFYYYYYKFCIKYDVCIYHQ